MVDKQVVNCSQGLGLVRQSWGDKEGRESIRELIRTRFLEMDRTKVQYLVLRRDRELQQKGE
jgi:hypothetical protein